MPDSDHNALERALEPVLRRSVPGFRSLTTCARLSGGASQELYRLDIATASDSRCLVLRRPPGGVTQDGITQRIGSRAEALVMACVGNHGVPVPSIVVVLEPADQLGEGFVMAWQAGETLGKRIVYSEQFSGIRPQLATQCGEILARLHAIDVETTGLATALPWQDAQTLVEQTWQHYQHTGAVQPMLDYIARWLLANLPTHCQPALVHNDFRNGNLVVDSSGLAAVLDWETSYIGDPRRDLAWLMNSAWRLGRDELAVGGFGEQRDLLTAYESASGQAVDRDALRFWQVFGSFWWSVVCLYLGRQFCDTPQAGIELAAISRRASEGQVDCVSQLIPGPVETLELPSQTGLVPPDASGLIAGAREVLRHSLVDASAGQQRFEVLMAAGNLDIALRELQLGPLMLEHERRRLQVILGKDNDVETLRRQVTAALRDGNLPLEHPGLHDYLRHSVVHQLQIDQPGYSGLQRAGNRTGSPV